MKPTEALAFAKGAARVRQVRWSGHSRERATQRTVTAEDLREALLSAKKATWQPGERTWKLEGGVDRDGEPLAVVVAIDGNAVRIVTEF